MRRKTSGGVLEDWLRPRGRVEDEISGLGLEGVVLCVNLTPTHTRGRRSTDVGPARSPPPHRDCNDYDRQRLRRRRRRSRHGP